MNEIILGNCMDVDLPKGRLLLTDIPYDEVNRESSGLRNLNKGQADEKTFELVPFLDKIYNCADIFVIFCGMKQFSTIFNYFSEKKGTTRQIIWAKNNPSPVNGKYVYLSGTENAVWFKKKGTGKLNCHCKKIFFQFPTGKSKLHPTEKNHKLLEEIILDNSSVGDLIIDPCAGSGSTALVAQRLGRKYFSVELDETYYNIAKERIEND